MKFLIAALCLVLLAGIGWGAWMTRVWRMERWVRGASSGPGLFAVGGRMLTVTSETAVRRLMRDPVIRAEVLAMAQLTARHGLDVAHFVLAREGWSSAGISVQWSERPVLHWLWLRLRDREAAARLKPGMNRWGEGPVPMWLLVLAWTQRLDDEEKTFLASLVRAAQLPQLVKLPGGVAAWIRAGVRRGEDAPVAWALSQPEYERLIKRHGENVVGLPRKLSQSDLGTAGLCQWTGPGFREEWISGIAVTFPGSVAELRKVLIELSGASSHRLDGA